MGKQVEKLLTIVLVILIMMVSCMGVVNAADGADSLDVRLTTTTPEIEVGKEIAISVSLANINVGEGVNTLRGVVGYDSKVLEYVNVESQNGWSAIYNSADGILLVTYMQGLVTADQVVAKLIFRVKEDVAEENVTVSFSDIESANTEIKVTPADASITFSVKAEDNVGGNEGNDGNNTGNNISDNTGGNEGNSAGSLDNGNQQVSNKVNTGSQNQVKSNTASSKMPHTGISDTVIYVIITIAIVIGVVSFVTYRKYRGI